MEEILIISNYYPPETGAASNRIEQLALKLQQNRYKISVICPLANYPKGEIFENYKGKFYSKENLQGIAVKRLWIYPSNSKNILKRIISVFSFASGLFFYLLFKKTPKKIIVQSPPLLLSFISVLALRLRQKKIILNVSDLWPLAAIELNAIKHGSFSHKLSLLMERYIYKNATLVLGQSNEIIAHVKKEFPNKKCFLYRNFPDHNIEPDFEISTERQPVRLFYAGLLGVAQGVFELCKQMDLNGLNLELHLFGDGAERKQIESYINGLAESKIFFHGMVDRVLLHEKLKMMDIGIVPLKSRIYGSVPSKIFEYGALGFPILYCGGGEGEDIVSEKQLGWVVEPGDFKQFNGILKDISNIGKKNIQQLKKRIFETSAREFDLNRQIKDLIENDIF
ncbi:MAG TPA: glycosyltransferase family 4 protein [Flavobacterium sp.]|nr:glycosyltransferase family 4 protein [Flavobacterium sp.]